MLDNERSDRSGAKTRREKCVFAAGVLVGLAILAVSLGSTVPQAIWLVDHGAPPWLVVWWLVGVIAMFAAPAWPRISWWLFKRRQVAGFARDAAQRVARLKLAGVTEIAALATVLNSATCQFEVARRSVFSTAWSLQPRALRELCECYSDRLEALAGVEQESAARLSALQAVDRFRRLGLAAMKADL